MTNHIRSPHDIPDEPASVLVRRWPEAQTRILSAGHQPDLDDLFTELAYGARIAQEVTAGRWCVVADLLRTGAAESWSQVGTAMDLPETDALDGSATGSPDRSTCARPRSARPLRG